MDLTQRRTHRSSDTGHWFSQEKRLISLLTKDFLASQQAFYYARLHIPVTPKNMKTAASDCQFVHSRIIDATPAQLFGAVTDPACLARWWGPEGFTSTFETFDVRPGGTWRFVMHGPDGTDYPNVNQFTVVEPPHRIEIEHISDDHHFKLNITFQGQDQGTVVGWEQTFDTAEHKQQIAPWVEPANEQNLDRLQREVAAIKQRAR